MGRIDAFARKRADTGVHPLKSPSQPTQKNEAQRTPQSRNDREAQIGSGNQAQSRRGGAGH